MNYIWPDIGNEKTIEILEKNIKNKKIANSYIFSGIKDLGKFLLAKSFAKNIIFSSQTELKNSSNILDVHGDFFIIEREVNKKNISIEQIKNLTVKLSLGSFLNSYKIVIIKDAENLNQSSASALLKVLEDFKDKLVVILTVNNIDLLPKTIISRSQIINLYHLDFNSLYNLLKSRYQASPSEAKNFARLSLGRPMLAIKFLQEPSYYNDYKEIFNGLLSFFSLNYFEKLKIINEIHKHDHSLSGNFDLLFIWQGIIRDLTLIHCGNGDIIQNEFAINDIKSLQLNDNFIDFIDKNKKILNQSSDYYNANFNIKSILEHIAINI